MVSILLTINQASEMLGVSIQTLRRWDESGKFPSIRKKKTGNRYYDRKNVEDYINNNFKDLFELAKNWVFSDVGIEPDSDIYCPDSSIFQARWERLAEKLSQIERLGERFSLIATIAGEIGDNSFAHNIGNWRDIPGVFFSHDLDNGIIILADRGQGVLTTLRNAKPELTNHQDALVVAFTETVSGRAPEARGLGLKEVKKIVLNDQEISLFFQTGDAQLDIQKNDIDLKVQKSVINLHGCLALIKF